MRRSSSESYRTYEDRLAAEVASKTYNTCTSYLMEHFDLPGDRSLSPRAQFEATVALLHEVLPTLKSVHPRPTIDHLSTEEIRSAFLFVADRLLCEADRQKTIIRRTRRAFIIEVMDYLHDHYGFVKLEKLPTKKNPRSGVYHKLNRHFVWLLRGLPERIRSENSNPNSYLFFG